jgi:hypothetical protein
MPKILSDYTTKRVAIQESDRATRSTQPAAQFPAYGSLAGSRQARNPEDEPRRAHTSGLPQARFIYVSLHTGLNRNIILSNTAVTLA